jgi:hypothetical protein
LYERYFEQGGRGLIEVRAIKRIAANRQRNKVRSFFITDLIKLASHINMIKKLVRKGFDVYVSVNPRPQSERKKQQDIRDIICLHADVDGKEFENGKSEALRRIGAFRIHPTFIVDSGNGFHAYWIFARPLLDISEKTLKEVKQTISGLVNAVRGDRQRINIDSVMRLPGTLNFKNLNKPRECRIIGKIASRAYLLKDFRNYVDASYPDKHENLDIDLSFEGNEFIVRSESQQAAFEDVQKLEISPRIRKQVITGALPTGEEKDRTRSGRDEAIITALLAAGYSFNTIKSVFFNPRLGCSNRIAGDLNKLEWDAKSALRYLMAKGEYPAQPKKAVVREIENEALKARDRTYKIRKRVAEDLLKGKSVGFKSMSPERYFIFDKSRKELKDIQSEEFRIFLVNTYGLLEKDLSETILAIQAELFSRATVIEIHKFAYYDREMNRLYFNRFDNQVYVLDGKGIELVDNGTEGVFFESKPEYLPYRIDKQKLRKSVNYFDSGFDYRDFCSSGSYVNEFLVGRASFASEGRYGLSPREQKYLLAIYFYSLFFESIQNEKPILCLVGVKASGKSFLAESIGRVLFGDNFRPNPVSDSLKDLKVMLSENSFVVLDNLDSSSAGQFLDVLCATATGTEMSSRKLYTDNDEVRRRPKVFVVITSRDPKFKRDDLVDRLLIFRTEEIQEPKSRTALLKELADKRNEIMTEVLANLNSILRLLRKTSRWNPPCRFRIADWELFGKRIHSRKGRETFSELLTKMNARKRNFVLEDDPLFILLEQKVCENNQPIIERTAAQIFTDLNRLSDRAGVDFNRYYRNPIALGKKLANIGRELNAWFEYTVREGRARQKLYTIKPRSR